MTHTIPEKQTFAYFRRAWSPRAAYHLTRLRIHPDWATRLCSGIWLVNNRVPLNGEAPTLNFKGLPQ